MSDLSTDGKSKYESPILVPLGALAKGSGVCTTGSSVLGNGGNGDVNGDACAPGAADSPVTGAPYCAAGTIATGTLPGYCEAGTTASPGYCTAGTDAATGCTDGVEAASCTDGASG